MGGSTGIPQMATSAVIIARQGDGTGRISGLLCCQRPLTWTHRLLVSVGRCRGLMGQKEVAHLVYRLG